MTLPCWGFRPKRQAVKHQVKKPAARHKSHDGFRSVTKDGTHDLMGGPIRRAMPVNSPASGPLPMPMDNDGDENPKSASPGAYL